MVLQQAPENCIKKVLLDKNHAEYIYFNLRKVILIDSQSTMDLLCNAEMVERIYKSKKRTKLRINGVKMVIDHKAVAAGYIKDMWVYKTSINNIFTLKNLIQKYRVTYDSPDQIFIVYRDENNKPSMNFRIHESGIHYCDTAEDFTFVNTVADNKKHYIKQKIKASERAVELYGTVPYTSSAEYRWAIQINQIK